MALLQNPPLQQNLSLQEGFFYKTCALYPPEVSEDSPCKSMVALVDSPVHEDTTMWYLPGMKIAKPHSCYLARFDPATSIGVIFLGSEAPTHAQRFVRVHGGSDMDTASTMLTTNPAAAFNEIFYLNLTHPLRVKLLYVEPPLSPNSLRRSGFGLSRGVDPPQVGITEYRKHGPRLMVSLDEMSRDTFWRMHKAYHDARPTRRSSLGLGGGVGAGAAAGGAARGAARGGGPVRGRVRGAGGAAPNAGDAYAGDADAPWGRVGKLRIGIDIPCILDDYSDYTSSDSDDAGDGERPFLLDGTVAVSDFCFGTTEIMTAS